MDAIRMETIHQAARERAAAPWGERGAIAQRTAAVLGLSPGRTQALLAQASKALSLQEPRQRRSDAGTTAVSDADLLLISGTMGNARRAGKWMLSCKDAIDMLHKDGKLSALLSAGRINRLLRERGLHPDQLAVPRPSARMRTDHPNAVWQIDFSVCVLHRSPKGELLLLEDGVHYKNKLSNYIKVMNDLLVRAVATDHASGAIATRFYLGGETTENALNFLMWLMTARTDAQGNAMPFHGVPFKIYTDQGSAFKSALFVNFCSALDIKTERHKPRNSQATGQVENGQNLVERGLESRLRYLDPESITMERLCALGELWMHAYNGTRKHSRHGMTRYGAWSLIAADELRIAPPMDVLRALPATVAKTRKVSTDMRVSFAFKGQGSHDYDVRYVPGISPKDEVYVTVNPFALPAVRVGVTDRETGEIVWHQVEPVQTNRFGFDVQAANLGEGEYRAMPTTPADERRKAIAAQAYATEAGPATAQQSQEAQQRKATPYLGQFDPLADLKAAQVPTYLTRKGVEHSAAAPAVEPVRLSVAEACKRMRVALAAAGVAYDSGTYAWLQERYGSDGVPEDVVRGLIASRRQSSVAAPFVGLRAVGGGT